MGADLLWAAYPHFDPTEERKKILEDLVETLVIKDFDDIGTWDLEDEDAINDLKARILASFDNVNFRSVSTITLGGPVHRITAGMSYGDSPTDTFDDFSAVSGCDKVYRLYEQWNREDAQRAQGIAAEILMDPLTFIKLPPKQEQS